MEISNLTVREAVSDLFNEDQMNETMYVKFCDLIIDIKTNSKGLQDYLIRYFKDFLVDANASSNDRMTVYAMEADVQENSFGCDFTVKKPEPGKSKIKEEYINFSDGKLVRKRITGMWFFTGKGFNFAIGPCEENSNQIINFVNSRFIQHELHNGAILGHAAAVELNGHGLAFAGFSGAGKSTLALHVMNRGTVFVSNDRLLVKDENGSVTMEGVAKLPRVNPGTVLYNEKLLPVIPQEKREEFLKLPQSELWDLEYKYDVFIDDIYGDDKFTLSAKMEGLVLLNWKRDDSPCEIKEINIAERLDLLPAFVKSPGLFYEPPVDGSLLDFSDENYINHLQKCTVFEVTGGVDFDKIADYCVEYLNSLKGR